MPELYPEIEPYKTGRLKVSNIHELYYELCGNPKGKPVVFLHGGPGSGCSPRSRQFFNPRKYNLILFDQRGSGRSTPHAELKENTTAALVADIEKLREHLGIKKWLVYGGSWGSTLGLAYAQAFPQNVTEMILWGIYLATKEETIWSFKNGANVIFPDYWEEFISIIKPSKRNDLVAAYYEIFTKAPRAVQLKAAKAWGLWEGRLTTLNPSQEFLSSLNNDDQFAMAHSQLECHYFVNNCFIKPGQLLAGVKRIKNIPAIIINGRYDMVCPLANAWKLHKAWPKSQLVIVPAAGHSSREIGMEQAIVKATDQFAKLTRAAKSSR
jgi:proline iminopeptidase